MTVENGIDQESEYKITTLRMDALNKTPIQGKYDFEHLRAVHEHIFEGLYDHAGKARDMQIYKFSPMGERGDFAKPEEAKNLVDEAAKALADKNFLKGLDQENFVKELTPIYAQINHAHPFEEGNGRAAQTMVRQIAADAGYEMDFSAVDRRSWANASAKAIPHSRMHEGVVPYSVPIDLKPLQKQLEGITKPLQLEKNLETEKEEQKYETPRAGRTYTGVIMSQDEDKTIQKTATGKLIAHDTENVRQLRNDDANAVQSIKYVSDKQTEISSKGEDRGRSTEAEKAPEQGLDRD